MDWNVYLVFIFYLAYLNLSLLNLKVISLGDIIKFSLSPSNTKDALSTNVSGVPLDDRNLVTQQNIDFIFNIFFFFRTFIQIIMLYGISLFTDY
jgi:hypothetical protein